MSALGHLAGDRLSDPAQGRVSSVAAAQSRAGAHCYNRNHCARFRHHPETRRPSKLERSDTASPAQKEAPMVMTNVQFARKGADAPAKQQPVAREAAGLRAAIDEMAPELAARAAEIESARRVPADIVDRLRQIGLFRTLLPRSHGGLALSVPEVLPLIEAVATADGSVGWVAMIGTASQMFFTRAPRSVFDENSWTEPTYSWSGWAHRPAGPSPSMAAMGLRRWPFASGCQNAQWMAAHFVVYQDAHR